MSAVAKQRMFFLLVMVVVASISGSCSLFRQAADSSSGVSNLNVSSASGPGVASSISGSSAGDDSRPDSEKESTPESISGTDSSAVPHESSGADAGQTTGSVLQQVAEILGESPRNLPTWVPLGPGYAYVSAKTERTAFGYLIIYYETKEQIAINNSALADGQQAAHIAVFEATVYLSKDAAAAAVDHHDASQGYGLDTPPNVDLGYGIGAYRNSGAGSTFLEWNEGKWLLETRQPISDGESGILRAKEIVQALETLFLPPPKDTGHIRIDYGEPSSPETSVSWQEYDVVYSITSSKDPLAILEMAASIKK